MKFKLWNGDIKKIFKRLLPIALATIIVFSFAGCGSKEQGGQSNVEPNPPIVTPVDPDKEDPDKENPGTQTNPGKDPDKQDPDDKQDPTTPTDPDDKKDPDTQDPDTPPVEEFDVAEHFEELKTKLKPTLDKMCEKSNLGYSEPNLLNAYICESQTGIKDTLGCIMTTNENLGFLYSEITLKNRTEDLTWKELCENGVGLTNYGTRNCQIETKYYSTNVMELHLSKDYDTTQTPLIFKKAFKITDFSPVFYSWRCNSGPQQNDYVLTYIDNNKIYSKTLSIGNNALQYNIYETILNNFLNVDDNNSWSSSNISISSLIPNNLKNVEFVYKIDTEIEIQD